MRHDVNHHVLSDLQERIDRIAGGSTMRQAHLAFGVDEIDRRLPGGGLAFGATHEIVGAGDDAAAAAVSSTFAAGIAARTTGQIIWCLSKADVFAPALQQAGLDLNRVIFVESKTNEEVLDCCEEALRYRGLGAVIAEVGRFSMIASRRLQLAAEKSGTIGLIVGRWRRLADAKEFTQPTASVTRWRVSPRPSKPLPVQGVGRPRWYLELLRAKAGGTFELEVAACGEYGRMASIEQEYLEWRMAE